MKNKIIPDIARKILSFFTDNSGVREDLSRPFLWKNYTCATNSKLLIAINNDYVEIGASTACPEGYNLDSLLHEALNSPIDADRIISIEDFNRACGLSSAIDTPDKETFLKVGKVMLRASLFHDIILAAQMSGASTISFIEATKSNQPVSFRLYEDDAIVAAGVIMPCCIGDDKVKILQLPYQSPIFPYHSQINLAAGEAFYNQYTSEQQQADEQYAASKKVYLVQVVKTAWVPVEAVDPRSAMDLAKEHTDGIDDDMFDNSEVEVEACNSYPEDDDDVDDFSEAHPRQGILTDDGWISWSKYYNEDETEDEFHQTRTTVKVDFGK